MIPCHVHYANALKKFMQAVPEKWRLVRAEEYAMLQKLLHEGCPLTHVIGPSGCGKSSLLKDLVRIIPSVTVDANTCGSVSGVMSCILRRLVEINTRNIDDPDASDSDVDLKAKIDIKSESGLTTPEDTAMEECINQEPARGRRKAAVVASAKLVTSFARRDGRALTRRKYVDEFIDEDSDSDAVENSSSDSGDEKEDLRETRSKVKNSTVPLHVLRLLHRAQQLRVRGESAFVQKLERVLIRVKQPTTLVIDNFDAILSPDDFDLDARGPGGRFLRLLSRLNEYVATDSGLSFIIVSNRMIPYDVSSRCVTVHMRPYSKEDCLAILSRGDDDRFDIFLKHSLAILYPAFSGNFGHLRDTIYRLYESGEIVRSNSYQLAARSKSVCSKELARCFGGGAVETDFEAQISEQRESATTVKWLSRTAKLVLISGYLAAHNPPGQDKVLFRTVSTTGMKRSAAASTAFKKSRINVDSIHIRAPVPFQVNRLLSIYRCVGGGWEEEAHVDAGLLFYRVVRELIQHGLFKGSCEDWLRGTSKLNCHAPLDLIQIVANETNVKLNEVLYG